MTTAKFRFKQFNPKSVPSRYWNGGGRLDFPSQVVRVNEIEPDIWLHVTSHLDIWRAHGIAKEPYTLEWMQTYFKPGDVFYDVGANVGVMSMVAQAVVGGLEIHAFEPVYMTLGQMQRNLVLNECEGINLWPLALMKSTAVQSMTINTALPGTSLNTIDGAEGMQQLVFGWSMRELDRMNIPDPTHIKIDVDGVEDRTVAGIDLAIPSLKTVQIEINHYLNGVTYDADSIYEAFDAAGFEMREKHPHINAAGKKEVFDCLFVRE